MGLCQNVKVLSFCHSERSEESLLCIHKRGASSSQAPLNDRMIGLLHFDTPLSFLYGGKQVFLSRYVLNTTEAPSLYD